MFFSFLSKYFYVTNSAISDLFANFSCFNLSSDIVKKVIKITRSNTVVMIRNFLFNMFKFCDIVNFCS